MNRIYAIGDIHGRLDLLEGAVEAIRREHSPKPRGEAGSA